MQGMSLDHILPKFINNTIYRNDPILRIIQIAMAAVPVEINKIPLTVISPFNNVPGKLGYYYTPIQLQQDKADGKFTMGEEQFERASYGVVRLKLDFSIEAKKFLITAIHEYIHAAQYEEEPDVMRIIGEDPMVVEAKEKAAYDLAEKLTGTVCEEAWVIKVLDDLDKELNWL